ncbi:hypothetical protein ABW19_dt0206126 [Dactylella cylindrospora]|nr:hypothetical protein ABW19_dt0206126 [Dactylella cylindrospora]
MLFLAKVPFTWSVTLSLFIFGPHTCYMFLPLFVREGRYLSFPSPGGGLDRFFSLCGFNYFLSRTDTRRKPTRQDRLDPKHTHTHCHITSPPKRISPAIIIKLPRATYFFFPSSFFTLPSNPPCLFLSLFQKTRSLRFFMHRACLVTDFRVLFFFFSFLKGTQ